MSKAVNKRRFDNSLNGSISFGMTALIEPFEGYVIEVCRVIASPSVNVFMNRSAGTRVFNHSSIVNPNSQRYLEGKRWIGLSLSEISVRSWSCTFLYRKI